MFASFPKLFDKNFVIGFLLPVIIGLFAFAWLCPQFIVLKPLTAFSANEDTLGKATYLALLTYGLAVLLMATNTLQYRLLEGYLPPVSWFPFLVGHHARGRKALVDERDELDRRWNVERARFPSDDQRRLAKVKRKLNENYPPVRLATMPTLFGNAIRAFEAYPFDVYGADATPVWLRLAAVIPKDFAAALEDARAQVNVFLNLFYILLAVIAVAAWRAVTDTPWAAFGHAIATHALAHWRLMTAPAIGLIAVVLIPFVYAMAVASAKAWGGVVKAAFDCYLPALIGQLGYAPPASEVARRTFWGEINALIVYWQPVNPKNAPLAGPPKPATPRGGLPTLFRKSGASDRT
jgi:hypothetical protein